MTNTKKYIWIDSAQALAEIAPTLKNSEYLAIDLEADNQHLYEEQVCLIQISNQERNYLIDTLAFKDLTPLHPLCANPSIPKIFHDLEFDLKCMHNEFNCHFKNLFDTKMAADLSGEEKSGLSALIEKHFHIALAKEYQIADWTVRPISEQMIQYSINDSYYLNELKGVLQGQLEQLGRDKWLEEECLLRERHLGNKEQLPEYLRIKASAKLKGKQLNLLKQLCELRDQIAKENKISRFQIFSNRSAITMSQAYPNPLNKNFLQKILRSKYQDDILIQLPGIYKVVKESETLTHPLTQTAVPQFIKTNVNTIKKWRMALSEKTKIPSAYLWPSETIQHIAAHPNILTDISLEEIPNLRHWQIQEFGTDFLKQIKPKLVFP